MQYQRIKETRIDKDHTQSQTAQILNITQQQYQLYESGKRAFPIDLLAMFCRHFKVSADYILELPNDLDWPR